MPIPTRSWGIQEDRLWGKARFEAEVANADERKRCILDPCYAKRKFADWGGFCLEGEDNPTNLQAIPATTVFRVYDSNTQRDKRDEEVVFVLPVLNNMEGGIDPTAHVYTWRCTYTPYREEEVADQKPEAPTSLS